MPREAKFNFVPLTSIADSLKEVKPTVTINPKGQIFFSKLFLEKYGVNKFVRFFIDLDKNALGWNLYDSIDSFDKLGTKSLRCIKVNTSKVAVLQIRDIIKHLKMPTEKVKLPVEMYNDRMYNDIYYVVIPTKQPNLYNLKEE